MTAKDEGLEKVRKNNKEDYLKLYGFAKDWIKTVMRPFTSEDLKLAFEELNTPPRQPNIYGAVMNGLSKEKLIKTNDYVHAKLKSAHSRLIHQWITMQYSELQASNRRKPDAQINLFEL